MNKPKPITVTVRAAALVGAFSLLAISTTQAAFVGLPPGTAIGGVALPAITAGDGTLTGTVLGVLDTPFSDLGTPPPLNTGLLRSFVVNHGGTLDFYYQLTSTSSPAEELERIRSIGGFDPSLTLRVDQVDGSTLAGLSAGTSGFVAGSYNTSALNRQAAATADRDQPSTGSVGFDFSQNLVDSNNLQGGEHSSFLVIRTDATRFGGVTAEITGTGGASYAASFAAVPEPSSLLFGLAMFGITLNSRIKSRRPKTA